MPYFKVLALLSVATVALATEEQLDSKGESKVCRGQGTCESEKDATSMIQFKAGGSSVEEQTIGGCFGKMQADHYCAGGSDRTCISAEADDAPATGREAWCRLSCERQDAGRPGSCCELSINGGNVHCETCYLMEGIAQVSSVSNPPVGDSGPSNPGGHHWAGSNKCTPAPTAAPTPVPPTAAPTPAPTIACPTHSHGTSVADGCTPDAGYAGAVTADPSAAGFASTIRPAPCPAHSTGKSMVDGCKPDPGYIATVTAGGITSAITPAPCPLHSHGNNVIDGCEPDAGYGGKVTPDNSAERFTSTIRPLKCPEHTTGNSVIDGCTPDAGYVGTVAPDASDPRGYSSSVKPAPCPPHSTGKNVIDGCKPAPGYIGKVVPAAYPKGYEDTLRPAPCPPHSTGANVVSGCQADDGYSGTVTICDCPGGYKSNIVSTGCEVGDAVRAQYLYNGNWYGAVVTKTGLDGSMSVNWADKMEDYQSMRKTQAKKRALCSVASTACKVGDTVESWFDGVSSPSSATINAINSDGTIIVDWTDGTTTERTHSASKVAKGYVLCGQPVCRMTQVTGAGACFGGEVTAKAEADHILAGPPGNGDYMYGMLESAIDLCCADPKCNGAHHLQGAARWEEDSSYIYFYLLDGTGKPDGANDPVGQTCWRKADTSCNSFSTHADCKASVSVRPANAPKCIWGPMYSGSGRAMWEKDVCHDPLPPVTACGAGDPVHAVFMGNGNVNLATAKTVNGDGTLTVDWYGGNAANYDHTYTTMRMTQATYPSFCSLASTGCKAGDKVQGVVQYGGDSWTHNGDNPARKWTMNDNVWDGSIQSFNVDGTITVLWTSTGAAENVPASLVSKGQTWCASQPACPMRRLGAGFCFKGPGDTSATVEGPHRIGTPQIGDYKVAKGDYVYGNELQAKDMCCATPKCQGVHYLNGPPDVDEFTGSSYRYFYLLDSTGTPDGSNAGYEGYTRTCWEKRASR